MSMKDDEFVSGLFLSSVSGGALWMAYRLGLGSVGEPGSGLIPFGTASILGLMSMGLLVKGIIKGAHYSQAWKVLRGVRLGTLLLVVCALLAYGITFSYLGFSLCTFCFVFLMLSLVGRKRWWFALAVSVVIVTLTHLVFVIWLGCEFPQGLLEGWSKA